MVTVIPLPRPFNNLKNNIIYKVYRCIRPQHMNTHTTCARLEYLVSSLVLLLALSLSLSLSLSPSHHLLYRFLVSLARSGRGLPSAEVLRKEDKLRIMKVSRPFSFYLKFPSQPPNSFEGLCPLGVVRKKHVKNTRLPFPGSWKQVRLKPGRFTNRIK
jgi:hypothetical protein